MKNEYGLALMLAASLLTACGGGDDTSGAPGAGQQRIARETVDYDGNGVADGTLRYFYDAQGRIASRQFTYTGDAAADVYGQLGTANRSETWSYDSAGRVNAYSTSSVNGSNAHTAQYGADGSLTRFDMEQKDGSGVLLNKQYLLYTYSGGRLTEINIYADTGALRAEQDITYGADGFPALVITRDPGGAATARASYTWTANGNILSFTSDTNGDAVAEQRSAFTYTNGRLTQGVKTTGGTAAGSPGAAFSYAYDGSGRLSRFEADVQSNGSVDGSTTIEYETGPCRAVTYYYTLPLATENGRQSSPKGELNYCAP